MDSDKKIIVHCQSCGAEFANTEPKCPYCGTIYIPGAETEYMNKLGDIREDMEDLEGAALSETASELKTATGKMFKIIFIIAAIIAGLFGITRIMDFIVFGSFF